MIIVENVTGLAGDEEAWTTLMASMRAGGYDAGHLVHNSRVYHAIDQKRLFVGAVNTTETRNVPAMMKARIWK